MKTVSLKLLKNEDIENLTLLKKHFGESTSTVIRQALRFYARSIKKQKKERVAA